MPMPRRTASPESVNGDHFAVDQDLALVGSKESEEDVHQGRLAGTVLTEQRVNLTGFDRQTDLVVGGEFSEALGHSSEFKRMNSYRTHEKAPDQVVRGFLFDRLSAVRNYATFG